MLSTTTISLHSQRQGFHRIRQRTVSLQEHWTDEDCMLQFMTETSPVRWHLAHTTWFFEEFVLLRHQSEYRAFDSSFGKLFNSYYESLGTPFPREQRGMLSRPGRSEIARYRQHVDAAMDALLGQELEADLGELIGLGLQHEQQHQELMITDLKAAFAINPMHPALFPPEPGAEVLGEDLPTPLKWHPFEGGLVQIGHGGEGFCFDNETPTLRTYLEPFELASRLVTNQEFANFIEAGGYDDHRWWLSDGWELCKQEDWSAPVYWQRTENGWQEYSVYGLRALPMSAPTSHLSFYEADAYARWAGARLPTEAEWETAARALPEELHDVRTDGLLQPQPAKNDTKAPEQLFGEVWQWTSSPYAPYRGYQPPAGPLGEYNGKFMSNQMVLRGGSCLTPPGHIRPSYRNFFAPQTRWQCSGLRLARDRD